VVMCDGKTTQLITLTPPTEISVGTRNTNLHQDLRWYLEDYMKLPIDGFCTHAEEVYATLSKWGRDCFDALFVPAHVQNCHSEIQQKDLSRLHIEIISKDPIIHSWPWEALKSQDNKFLAQQHPIKRRISSIDDNYSLSNALLKDELNILYIISRPYGDNDIDFQIIVRPLIDFINKDGWPVHIDVLRPPTFDKLQQILKEKPNFYDIIHFDGHGNFDVFSSSNDPFNLGIEQNSCTTPVGMLAFEKDDSDHSEDLIVATKLGELLREHEIPIMILNACRSAMQNEQTKNIFASVATNLLQAGINSIVAMSYGLWDSGAQKFVPAFYRHLFKNGDVSGAMLAGRQAMCDNKSCDAFFKPIDFHDWIVPVLYQQSFEKILPKLEPTRIRKSKLPNEAQLSGNYSFIGRGQTILQLERTISLKPAGILIHGMVGEGKTTIVKGFLQWLEATNGLAADTFWFNFKNKLTIDYIVNILTDALFKTSLHYTQIKALHTKQQLNFITKELKNRHVFIVWDNFESVSDISDTEASALRLEENRILFKQFFHDLYGGKTKVLITSRSPENWLFSQDGSLEQDCIRFPLEGLSGEDLWQYRNIIVSNLKLPLEHQTEQYRELMDKLEGNPQLVQNVLQQLRKKSAKELLIVFEANSDSMFGIEENNLIHVALSVFGKRLDPNYVPVLRLLGLHEYYVNANLIEEMLKLEKTDRATINCCFNMIENAGLCRSIGNSTYKMHPVLRGYFTQLYPAREIDKRVFATILSHFVDAISPKGTYKLEEWYEIRGVFTQFNACFYRAIKIAQELNVPLDVMVLTQGLVNYALNIRNFSDARNLCNQFLKETAEKYNIVLFKALAYGLLGLIAQEQRDFKTAIEQYTLALDISLDLGDNEERIITYYNQLGNACLELRDFGAAETWYKKVLQSDLVRNDEKCLSTVFQHLGIVAAEQNNFDVAEGWYVQSLAIRLKLGDAWGVAKVYHQLGRVKEARGDFGDANLWYKKALELDLEHGNVHGAALRYHHLGSVAEKLNDLDDAKELCIEALKRYKQLRDKHGEAKIYSQLGIIATRNHDVSSATCFFKKAQELFKQLGDQYFLDAVNKKMSTLNKTRNQ